MANRFETDFTGAMTQAVRSMFPVEVDQRLVDSVVTSAVGTNRAAAVAIMRDYKNLDLKSLLRSAGVPVRCINVPPRDEGGLETAVEKNRAYADFDAVILMGSGHYPMLDQPAAFNEKLRRWIEEVGSS
jgi:pimeloyl-ACP methyl ester carboxylesterase